MEEESWRRNHRAGIMEEESSRRNRGGMVEWCDRCEHLDSVSEAQMRFCDALQGNNNHSYMRSDMFSRHLSLLGLRKHKQCIVACRCVLPL